jgi:RNA polymerase sigma-70 factor (sigma-E family)
VPDADLNASFDSYVAARYPALVRTATLLTGDPHEAEDLVQGALVKAVGVWRRIVDDPEPYVRRIMVNDNISRWRRHRGRTVVSGDPAGTHDRPVPEEPVEARLDLAAALGTLAPRQRTVVVLRYFEDLTERETAALMGIAVGTVKSQTRDALARLRRVLPDLTTGEGDGSAWQHGGHAQRDEGVPHR